MMYEIIFNFLYNNLKKHCSITKLSVYINIESFKHLEVLAYVSDSHVGIESYNNIGNGEILIGYDKFYYSSPTFFNDLLKCACESLCIEL